MNILPAILISFSEIRSHKLRSFLTMLGVVLGVATYIVLFTLLKGAIANNEMWMNEMGGIDKIELRGRKPDDQELKGVKAWKMKGRSVADAQALAGQTDVVRFVAPEVVIGGRLKGSQGSTETGVHGATPAILKASNYLMGRGRFFTDSDQEQFRKVCVLGSKTAEKLFGKEDPLGKTLVIQTPAGGMPFEVVGLLKHNEMMDGTRNMMDWKNEMVYVPLATLLKRIQGGDQLSSVHIMLKDGSQMTRALDQLGNLMLTRHGVMDFRFSTHEEWATQSKRASTMFSVILGTIGGICLVTGGVGIMNIMLASVNERTREIGIRRALGARRKDILLQFFIETLIISMSGGLLGVVLSIILGLLFALLPEQRAIFSFSTICMGFSTSVVVGLFFGIYPARRASQLSPIEALRYE